MKMLPLQVTRKIGRAVLQTKKNSPHIFFGLGLAGVVGSTVLACRATLKLEPLLDEIKTDVDKVVGVAKDKDRSPDYTEQQYRKDLGSVYIRSGVKVAKLYGPSVLLGTASVAALTGSHVQMTRRNAALTATVAIVTKAYDDYRLRVQEALGEEKELDIYRSVKEETVTVDGKKVKRKIQNPDGLSDYYRIFDPTNPNWKPNEEYLQIFVQGVQNYCNHKLNVHGYVFLNDVYDMLGFEKTKAGQVVGWVIDGEGDGYIDFGLYQQPNVRFIVGHDLALILDFNVDGVVLGLMKESDI